MAQKRNQKETKQKQNKTLVIASIVLFIAVVSTFLMYSVFGPQPTEGAKTITIQVVDDQQNMTVYETHTDAEYLRQAMEETKVLTFIGTEGSYGLMLNTINGVTADYDKDKTYWAFYVNDEYGTSGVDTTVIEEGAVYSFRIAK